MRMCACRGTAGFAHVSCLAEQAKILFAEAVENNLGAKAWNERWMQWESCSLCEQKYYGVVRCALGWACWKTHGGQPEEAWARGAAMTVLGNGLADVKQYEDALAVREADLAMRRHLGESENNILVAQSNLASTYHDLGRAESALSINWDVYSTRLERNGEEPISTLSSQ